MEYWSVGFKNGNRSDFYSFAFGNARSKHGLYFSIIPTIHHSITPLLQYSGIPDSLPSLKLRPPLFAEGLNALGAIFGGMD